MLRRVWRWVKAWVLRNVYIPYLHALHLKLWPRIERVRGVLKLEVRTVPCCRHKLGPPSPYMDRSDLQIRVCGTCKRRHFELTVDPIALGIVSR